MIATAGISSKNTQLLINAINPIFSMMGAVYGASLLDKLGRRTMMLGGLAGALVCYILLTAFTAQTANDQRLSYGVIVAIYLFGIFFAWGFTPLQTLYAVECLENRTRAKGSGLNFLFLNIAMVRLPSGPLPCVTRIAPCYSLERPVRAAYILTPTVRL